VRIQGKKIVLTGAASGIGKAILEKLITMDTTVVVGDINPEKIPMVSERVYPLHCDVSKKENIDRLFSEALRLMGDIDIFIANAGYAYYETLDTPDWDHIAAIMETDFISPVYAIEKMRELKGDREHAVVITASSMARRPIPGYALYSAAKAALDSFIRAYRYESPDSALISLVFPIATKTEFFSRAGSGTPMPWPSQTPEQVAAAILNGIRKNRKSIYPSRLFFLLMIVDRIFPLILPLYAKIQDRKFRRWVRERRNNDGI